MILFDFDGTIADTLEYLFTIGNELAAKFNYRRVERHEIEHHRNLTLRQLMKTLGVSPFNVPAILIQGKRALRARIHEVKIFEGVDNILNGLKERGIRLGVVSTNTRENIEDVLRNHGLKEAVEFICIGSGVLGKAHALRKAVKEHRLDIGCTLFVGDEIRDLEAARRAGIPFAAVGWGYNNSKGLRAHKPDYLADHPHELLSILESFVDGTVQERQST